MISDHDLETKDFSITLRRHIDKVQAVSVALQHVDSDILESEGVIGVFGDMLQDAVDDLRAIDKALYP